MELVLEIDGKLCWCELAGAFKRPPRLVQHQHLAYRRRAGEDVYRRSEGDDEKVDDYDIPKVNYLGVTGG